MEMNREYVDICVILWIIMMVIIWILLCEYYCADIIVRILLRGLSYEYYCVINDYHANNYDGNVMNNYDGYYVDYHVNVIE